MRGGEAPPTAAPLSGYHVNWMRSGWRECGTGPWFELTSPSFTDRFVCVGVSHVQEHQVWAIRHIITSQSKQTPLRGPAALQGCKQRWSRHGEPTSTAAFYFGALSRFWFYFPSKCLLSVERCGGTRSPTCVTWGPPQVTCTNSWGRPVPQTTWTHTRPWTYYQLHSTNYRPTTAPPIRACCLHAVLCKHSRPLGRVRSCPFWASVDASLSRQHDSHPQTLPLVFRQDLNQNVRLCFMFSSSDLTPDWRWPQEALFSFHHVFVLTWGGGSAPFKNTMLCLTSFISFFIFMLLLLLWGKTHKGNPVPTKCYIVFLYHILCR